MMENMSDGSSMNNGGNEGSIGVKLDMGLMRYSVAKDGSVNSFDNGSSMISMEHRSFDSLDYGNGVNNGGGVYNGSSFISVDNRFNSMNGGLYNRCNNGSNNSFIVDTSETLVGYSRGSAVNNRANFSQHRLLDNSMMFSQ